MRTRAKSLAFGGLIVALYLYCFPYSEDMRSSSELPRVYLTEAMVDEATFAIDTGVELWGKTGEVARRDGHDYLRKAPGAPLLAAPAYWCLKLAKGITGSSPTRAETTWALRVFTGVLPTLLFLLLLWRFLQRFAPEPQTRRLVLVGYALGSMALSNSMLFNSHQLAAVCVGTAYILSVWVVEGRLDRRWLWVAGFAGGSGPLVNYPAALAGIPIAAYLVWKLVIAERKRWLGVLYAIGGAVPPLVILLFYNARAFGSPFRTSYRAISPHASSKGQRLAEMGQQAVSSYSGSGPLLSPDTGLLIFCPMLMLAILGWVLMARRKQCWHLGITLSVATSYLAYVYLVDTSWWRDWQIGPSHMTVSLPFLLIPIAVAAAWSERHWVARSVVVGLIGVGVVVYGVSTALFPHFPAKFANPLFDLTFHLLRDGYAAYSAGWLIGLSGFASLVPYLLMLAGAFVWVAVPSAEARRSGLLGLALCATLICAYSLFPRGAQEARRAYPWVESFMPAR